MSSPIADLVIRLSGDTRNLGRDLGQAEGRMTRFTGLGLAAAAGIAGGAVAAGVSILKLGVAYHDSLNTFQAVSHANAAQMQLVANKAKQLGNDLSIPGASAKDAAEAMTELAKGGLSVADAMTAAQGTLRLAAAAQVSGAQAAQIQAITLAQFGLSGAHAAHVADLLANAANAASGEITDVAEAMKYVGPVAKSMGISVDSASTTIALLAKNGILGSQAGTSLRGALAGLAAPGDRAKTALSNLGIQAFDANGKFRGLEYITGQLATAQGKMTVKQFQANAAMAFGREPLAAINALAKEGKTGFDAMALAVGKNGGASEVAAAKMKGLGGAWQGLISTLEGIEITIYDKVAPALEVVVRALADHLQPAIDTTLAVLGGLGSYLSSTFSPIFAPIGRGFKAFSDGLHGIGAVGYNASTFIHDLGAAISALANSFKNYESDDGSQGMILGFEKIGYYARLTFDWLSAHIGPVMDVLAGALGGAGVGAVAALAVAIGGPLLAALGALVSLLGAPVIVAGALVGAFVALYKRSATVRDVIAEIGKYITGTALPALMRFGGYVKNTVIPALIDFAETKAIPALKTFGHFLIDTVYPNLLKVGRFLYDTFLPSFRAIGKYLTGSVLPALRGLAVRLRDNAPEFLKVAKFVGALTVGIAYLALKITGFLIPIFYRFAGPILRFVIAALGVAIGVFGHVVNAIDDVRKVVSRVIGVLATLAGPGFAILGLAYGVVKAALGPVISFFGSVISKIGSVSGTIAGFASTGVAKFRAFAAGVIRVLGPVISTIGHIASGIQHVLDLLPSLPGSGAAGVGYFPKGDNTFGSKPKAAPSTPSSPRRGGQGTLDLRAAPSVQIIELHGTVIDRQAIDHLAKQLAPGVTVQQNRGAARNGSGTLVFAR